MKQLKHTHTHGANRTRTTVQQTNNAKEITRNKRLASAILSNGN